MGGAERWHGILRTVTHACQARRAIWFLCMNCGHARRIDPRKLMTKHAEAAIADLGKKIRCQRCQQKHCVAVADDRPMWDWPMRADV